METENWIKEIMNSTNGMTQAVPSANLFDGIQQRIFKKNATVSIQTVWLAASSMVLLVTINIGALQNKKSAVLTSNASTKILEVSLNKSNQFY